MTRLEFKYGVRGYGDLILTRDGSFVRSWLCRTGSINAKGQLVNAIDPTDWQILKPSVETAETAMIIDGYGWKIRLYTEKGEYTHYLIHPDGNLPGTAGCIGIQGTNAKPLKNLLDEALKSQHNIPVHIEKIT